MKRDKSPKGAATGAAGLKKPSKTSVKVSSKESLPKPMLTSKDSYTKPKILKKLLNVQDFVKTIRRNTDLATQIDWKLLSIDQQHSKILDLSQLVINDLFAMITDSFVESKPSDIVSDFVKTFHPVVVGLPDPRETEESQVKPTEQSELMESMQKSKEDGVLRAVDRDHNGYKSFDTFGGDKAAALLT